MYKKIKKIKYFFLVTYDYHENYKKIIDFTGVINNYINIYKKSKQPPKLIINVNIKLKKHFINNFKRYLNNTNIIIIYFENVINLKSVYNPVFEGFLNIFPFLNKRCSFIILEQDTMLLKKPVFNNIMGAGVLTNMKNIKTDTIMNIQVHMEKILNLKITKNVIGTGLNLTYKVMYFLVLYIWRYLIPNVKKLNVFLVHYSKRGFLKISPEEIILSNCFENIFLKKSSILSSKTLIHKDFDIDKYYYKKLRN